MRSERREGVSGMDDRSRARAFNARSGGQTAGDPSGEAHPCAGLAQAMSLEGGGGGVRLWRQILRASDWISADRSAIVSILSAGFLHTLQVTV